MSCGHQHKKIKNKLYHICVKKKIYQSRHQDPTGRAIRSLPPIAIFKTLSFFFEKGTFFLLILNKTEKRYYAGCRHIQAILMRQKMAKVICINPINPQDRLIAQVVEVLRYGGVICYPTDTMYGIGCDIFSQKAVKRVYQIKHRPKDKPFSFMCASLTNISNYGHVGNAPYRIMRKCLPGPYTFVLSGTKVVPKIMLTRQKTVGIRVPDYPICLALIDALGNPILNTSAQLEQSETPVRNAMDAEDQFGKQVDLIIDAGEIIPEPSTVISLLAEEPQVLRQGKGDSSLFL